LPTTAPGAPEAVLSGEGRLLKRALSNLVFPKQDCSSLVGCHFCYRILKFLNNAPWLLVSGRDWEGDIS